MRIFSMRNFNPRDYWRLSLGGKEKPEPIPSPLEEFKPKEPEPTPEEATKRKMEDLVEPVQKKKRQKVRLPW